MMKVQSASLDVPSICPNRCKFCVTELWRKGNYSMFENAFDFKSDDINYIKQAFKEKLIYLRQQNVDTIVFTGSASEAIYNKQYLELFRDINHSLRNDRFINIELQTSGVSLIENLTFLEDIGVKTISLSLASLDPDTNFDIMQTPKKLRTWNIDEICKKIKEAGFNLRLILNMNLEGYKDYEQSKDKFWHNKYGRLLSRCHKLDANQVTFRKLYSTDENNEIATWIRSNQMDSLELDWWEQLNQYVKLYKQLNRLSFGVMKYSIYGMSIIVDEDCMSKDSDKENLRHLILRRNCHLYSEWDDPASLVF